MQHITININNVSELKITTNTEDAVEIITKGQPVGESETKMVETETRENENITETETVHVPKSVLRGDIWLAELTDTKYLKPGEQGGFRPVLVVQNNIGNKYSPSIIGLCITSKNKKDLPTHVVIENTHGCGKDSTILCEQIVTVSKQRLNRKIGTVSFETMQEVNKKILFSLALDGQTR